MTCADAQGFPSAASKGRSTVHQGWAVPVTSCCLTDCFTRDGHRILLLFLLTLGIRRSADCGGDGVLCRMACLLGPEQPSGLFTPMAVPGGDDLEDWGLAATDCRHHEPGTVVLLLGGWCLLLDLGLS